MSGSESKGSKGGLQLKTSNGAGFGVLGRRAHCVFDGYLAPPKSSVFSVYLPAAVFIGYILDLLSIRKRKQMFPMEN